eukprot:gnl/TRDRNA2_/TRDRNA2_138415_c1_seq4.p1 gnl/TRDRNA2_/TRDRNA2_138415_c1~~gnl/TRDRNA2_/TRDRNA2_138415_c1_seq4.p1  ORF type:complete len:274 (-),score=17.16 gnl/TRDRNA2_/TRDRNA2_138415_c1_seq4:82-843(-)
MQIAEEIWRRAYTSGGDSKLQHLWPRPHLKDPIQKMLQALVPPGHGGACSRASSLVVESVEQVQNVLLWKRYCNRQQEMASSLRGRLDCPWVAQMVPALDVFRKHLPHMSLDENTNEVLLLHGTTGTNVQNIAAQGFDDRLSGSRDLYGAGIYFTTDSCKALQYCGKSVPQGHYCLFLSRVLLGHPYNATGPMKTHKRPPIAEGYGVPHDSTIARPGIHNTYPNGQVHWEFVVPGSQAYPELVVHFRDGTVRL